jgi:hypothetical protein
MPDKELKFSQPDSQLVESWEFQYSKDRTNWEFVTSVNPVDGCTDCFQVTVQVPDENITYFRSRAIGYDGTASDWSNVVALPETPAVLSVSLGVVLLMHLFKRYSSS